MALSEDNAIKIGLILGVYPWQIEDQVNRLNDGDTPPRFTDAIQAAAEDEIARWDDGAGTKFTKLHPMTTNKGVETFPEAIKQDIRFNLATLLERPDWISTAGGASSYEVELARG